MAAANHMPQLKQYCSWMFKREDWEVTHLHKLIEQEYENHTIQMPMYLEVKVNCIEHRSKLYLVSVIATVSYNWKIIFKLKTTT